MSFRWKVKYKHLCLNVTCFSFFCYLEPSSVGNSFTCFLFPFVKSVDVGISASVEDK